MLQETVVNQNSGNLREELKVLITGDKPKNLLAENSQGASLAYSKQMSDALEIVSERALNKIAEDNQGKKIVLLTGLELGVEQAAARRAVDMGIEVRAFVSHREHGKNWSVENQKHYQELTRRITESGGTINGSDKEYSPQRTQLRDYRMVDEAQIVVSLHDPGKKAAHQKTLDYAAKHSKIVLNVWNDAEKILSDVSRNFDRRSEKNLADAKYQSPERTNKIETNNQTMRRIEIRERITREDVRAENDKIFLFGDNLKQTGYGGQAKEMRGEANARGIPTKKEPSNKQSSFFIDKEFDANRRAIDEAFGRIPPDKTIVVPKGGIGTGLARLEEKAPRTFAYLNEKLATLGFDNRRGQTITSAPRDENRVVIENLSEKSATRTRLLDLNNIQTDKLKLLSPSEKEVAALAANRSEALSDYAARLRFDYKENRNGLRDGMKVLSDALDKGEQITVACACRNGEMCHADVVKMAVEKINSRVKSQQIREANQTENESRIVRVGEKTNSNKPENKTNPRTLKAIAEILAISETDKLLAQINETDGRNQSEQATHLGKFSQFVRDIYERGGNVIDGKLIVPKDSLAFPPPVAVTTQDYAVKRLSGILKDESKAKEIAPTLIDYGNKIAGTTADGETKLKVFAWMYTALEGKSEFLKSEENSRLAESREQKFENALAEISRLAEEMHRLEPSDKIEFAPLNDFELESEKIWEQTDENTHIEEIYENAIGRDAANGEIEQSGQNFDEQNERGSDSESSGKTAPDAFDRIDLSDNAPQLPAEFTETEIAKLLTETLPEIDRRLESGTSVKEIIKPFHENVRQSAKSDALNRLETIYKRQKISELETKLSSPQASAAQKEKLESEISHLKNLVLTPSWDAQREILAGVRENDFKGKTTFAQASGKIGELSETVKNQIEKIDVRRQNVITLGNPSELLTAYETAEKSFYQKTRMETADLRLKIAEIGESKENSVDKNSENALKKQLNEVRNLKSSFAFKLENQAEIIVGRASTTALDERAFISSYIKFQLKQPETRFRHENERYRTYAVRLEAAENRDEVIKTSSDIRAENAALGIKWKDLSADERAQQPRPLTDREMRFLFTEISPAHYKPEMTVARLSFAHSGASRRQLTEALLKGEIKPSPETQKLIDSLSSRLERRELKDSLLATKHFFESLKTPNENLKYKNQFDHREIYRKLPPQEKDFVYAKTTRQKENLEYRLAFKQRELIKGETESRERQPKLEQSSAEKSFHLLSKLNQARILGEGIETSPLASLEISERDFRAAAIVLQNQPGEKTLALGHELKQSASVDDKKLGEILETFSKAEITKEGEKTTAKIRLPENSRLDAETYKELLERFYPDDKSENGKFKFSSFHEKTLEEARIKGQDETLKTRQTEIGNNFFAADLPAVQIFQTERALFEDLPKVAEMQRTARIARDENAQVLEKYASRTAFKTEKQQTFAPNREEQKQIVETALRLSPLNANLALSQANQKFFEAVQMEIAVSDFQKFGANEKIIAASHTNIRKTFSEIAAKEIVLEENRTNMAKIRAEDKLQDVYFKSRQAEENRLLTRAARMIFEQTEAQNLEGKSIVDLVSGSEKNEIKTESANRARIALEPEYKNFEEKGYNDQAIKLADAIEKAHELSKTGATAQEITKAFDNAEIEREILLQKSGETLSKDENKPLSLRLYEAEIQRAEKQILAQSLSEKLAADKGYTENEKTFNLETIFSPEEREHFKQQAIEIAKERLEPKELDANHRKISTEAGRQAVTTFKQLEQAHNVFQFSNDPTKIREAFSKLDTEVAALNKIRQDYNRAEKLAVLRDGIKTDIADYLRKNSNPKSNDFIEQTNKILTRNFEKIGAASFAVDKGQILTLSREISDKIETKFNPPVQERVDSNYFDKNSNHNKGSEKSFETTAKTIISKDEKIKESFAFSR